MATVLTSGSWNAQQGGGSKHAIWTSTVSLAGTPTSLYDMYTLRTPGGLDVTRQWTLLVAMSAAIASGTVPINLWLGFNKYSALTGDGTTTLAAVTTTINGASSASAVLYKTILDNIGNSLATPVSITFDPNSALADVVAIASQASGLKVKPPVVPFYIFDIHGGAALSAVSVLFTIIQSVQQ